MTITRQPKNKMVRPPSGSRAVGPLRKGSERWPAIRSGGRTIDSNAVDPRDAVFNRPLRSAVEFGFANVGMYVIHCDICMQ